MRKLVSLLDRLLPSVLAATSVTLLTAGLLSCAPSAVAPNSSATGSESSFPSSSTIDLVATPTPTYDPPPTPPNTSQTPGQSGQGLASRIRIPSLDIDLPVVPNDLVVPGNIDFYPLCDVAQFLRGYVQPGQIGATYIYAHARSGMFGPILEASLSNDGESMIGALIEVYTSDNKLHLYELYLVRRHATDLSLANAPPGVHMLVLQTSEGVSGTVPKLQVAARPLSVVPADALEANPTPQPRVCLPS